MSHKIWMIMGFTSPKKIQIYKYKMAKNQPGVWFSFFREIFLLKKKVQNGLPPRRFLIFLFFLSEENFKILRKKAKNGLSPGVFLRGEGFTPGGGF